MQPASQVLPIIPVLPAPSFIKSLDEESTTVQYSTGIHLSMLHYHYKIAMLLEVRLFCNQIPVCITLMFAGLLSTRPTFRFVITDSTAMLVGSRG